MDEPMITFAQTLSSVVALGANIICSKIPGLAPQQRTLCQKNPDSIIAIWEGATLAFNECEYQFRHERWNCSTLSRKSIFHPILFEASKEAAFTYAISSSGVMYALVQACSKGNISKCGCDKTKEGGFIKEGWKWGGCSADVKYGMRLAKKFLDSREIEGDERSLMNLHNNRAGRKVLRVNTELDCKCHGVSGSCTMKTCWKSLPPFRKIGKILHNKYKKAKQVEPIGDRRSRRPIFLKLKGFGGHKKPKKGHLVYLKASPSYCQLNFKIGSLGTKGRKCSKREMDSNSCSKLCCGRGYNTLQTKKDWQCNCKFHWCCYVECNTCTKSIEEYTCK